MNENVRQVPLDLMRAHVVGEVLGLVEGAPTDEPEMSAVAVWDADDEQRQFLAVDGEFADALLIGFEAWIVGEFRIIGDGAEAAYVSLVEQRLQILYDAAGVDLIFLARELKIFGGALVVAGLRSLHEARERAARRVAAQGVRVFDRGLRAGDAGGERLEYGLGQQRSAQQAQQKQGAEARFDDSHISQGTSLRATAAREADRQRLTNRAMVWSGGVADWAILL